MSCLTSDPASGFRSDRVIRALYLLFAISLLGLLPLSAQTVATYDFEGGSTQGWGSFNGASTPVSTDAAAYSGSYSLLTTTGSSGAGGPSISLNGVLLAGATYTITGWVELTSGESAQNANFTMKRSDPGCSGGTCYDTIGTYQVPVNDSGWTEIGGIVHGQHDRDQPAALCAVGGRHHARSRSTWTMW